MSAVDQLLGSVLVGIFIAAILYGITTTQAFVYYQNYPNDQKLLKWMVGLIWFLETLHTGFCIDFIYKYVITEYGNAPFMNVIYWSGGITVIIGVLVAALVHGYYVRRVWILSDRNTILTAVVTFLAVLRFGDYTLSEWSVFRTRKLPLMTLAGGLSSAAAVDLLVAGALCYFLERNRTGFQRSDSRINLLMAYIINTGALTTVFSLIIVITFAAMNGSLVFLAFVEIQSKLYANSFLASLNARRKLMNSGARGANGYPTYELSNGGRSHIRSNTTGPVLTDGRVQIEIFHETTRIVDSPMSPTKSVMSMGKEAYAI
ncbi:hypothetical protein GLOTRDRAFT_103827 [Gloeophyllum trabeum ATCC 11539]|uniref:DUF6534 domain-containing protein n=1 Tax=Gloeophyllum trabeum (strain ATCC 11539 / FP-39264 / Madison 617) TaxID=670483 RepID=S7QET4_GLOTA|nr:uncharacterized protein GLOTRDRAFT_103827 [Gloeophyllum trabeum ATCC 11539]EPQ57813.1 hypothetical protein GLOTRDRAFT_103827 [Gloeophyllum trabeum ATCC 11539]